MANTANNPQVINVNRIVEMITVEGKTREEIKKELNLGFLDAKLLFSHPKLKGIKRKKLPTIQIVDEPLESHITDEAEVEAQAQTEVEEQSDNNWAFQNDQTNFIN